MVQNKVKIPVRSKISAVKILLRGCKIVRTKRAFITDRWLAVDAGTFGALSASQSKPVDLAKQAVFYKDLQ